MKNYICHNGHITYSANAGQCVACGLPTKPMPEDPEPVITPEPDFMQSTVIEDLTLAGAMAEEQHSSLETFGHGGFEGGGDSGESGNAFQGFDGGDSGGAGASDSYDSISGVDVVSDTGTCDAGGGSGSD